VSHIAPPKPGAATESAPSADRLTFGLNLAADVVLAIGLVFFVTDAGRYPVLPLNLAAWALLLIVTVLTQLGAGRLVRLPTAWWTIARIVLAVVVVLDVFGVLGQVGDVVSGPFPTAAIGAGAVLAMFATTQSARSVNLAVAALGVLIAADILLASDTAIGPELAPGVFALALAVVPPIVAVTIVTSFRNMVQFQADLSLAKGTTSAAGMSLGLSTSEELVRLDLQAERLLDDVASGRTPLPLSTELAEAASTIATQLRLNLVASKSRTWLHHALTESSVLGAISIIDDPDGLAAGLAPDQRDGLLTAIWMLAGDGERVAQALTVTVRRGGSSGVQAQRLAVTLELIGAPKRRIDPAAWQAISKVGRFAESHAAPTLRIDIDCALDVVADR